MQINEIFDRCHKLSMSKRHDYTASLDNHENFKRSAVIASWFVSEEDKPYVVLIGTKLARLASLLIPGRTPNNESIEDTFLDLVNYCALWMERRTTLVANINNGPTPEQIRQGALLQHDSSKDMLICTCIGEKTTAAMCPVHRYNPTTKGI